MPSETTGERLGRVKTKIVATVGPACGSREMLAALVQAGVDVFRLNFAHGTHIWLAEVVKTIRQISAELRRPIGILGDLAGPKIRLEELPNGVVHCHRGDTICFVRRADPAHPEYLTCTYAKLVDELHPGDRVLLADGAVSLTVVDKIAQEDRVVCRVEQPGDIRSRQGINLPGVALSTPSLTEKDRNDLAWGVLNGLDFIGLSFVRNPTDIVELRQAIHDLQPPFPPQIVAKIEMLEAIDHLEQIIDATDAVMVARGDLGVEVDLAMVPIHQKRIIRLCNERRVPVITATQMLESMTHNNRPTRAETTDVANAVLDGTDAVMLSGETAAGEYPVEAVAVMSRICHEAEQILRPRRQTEAQVQRAHLPAQAVTEAVTMGAVRAAEQMHARLIVVATRTGKTAMALSQQRSRTPILGFCNSAEAARRLCLYWGVTPVHAAQLSTSVREQIRTLVEWGLAEHVLSKGDVIVLVTGANWPDSAHDLMVVHQVP